jgi:hypothetical protein
VNIRRGLLRLWVVATVLWMVPAWWLEQDELAATREAPPELASFPSSLPPDFTMTQISKPPDASKFLIVSPDGHKFELTGPKDSAIAQAAQAFRRRYPDLFSDNPRNQRVADWTRRWFALSVVLFPPLVALVFGAALTWAIRGFRE